MNDNLNILKTDLNQVVPFSICADKEIKNYLSYVDESYTITNVQDCHFIRNNNSDASVKIKYAVRENDSLVEKNQVRKSYDKINIRIKTELGEQELFNGAFWEHFLDRWYELFVRCLKKQYDLLWSNNEKLNVELVVYASATEANVFNLLAVGLIKSLSEAKLNVSDVPITLKDYINVANLPHYFYALIGTESHGAKYYLIVNPGSSDLLNKIETKGHLSCFLTYNSKKEALLHHLNFETYGVENQDFEKTVENFLSLLKVILA